MAKCDLCDGAHPAHELVTLRDCYQVADVKDVCPKCEKWVTDELWKIRAENALELRRRIVRRIGTAEPKKPFWRRLFHLPTPRPNYGEY